MVEVFSCSGTPLFGSVFYLTAQRLPESGTADSEFPIGPHHEYSQEGRPALERRRSPEYDRRATQQANLDCGRRSSHFQKHDKCDMESHGASQIKKSDSAYRLSTFEQSSGVLHCHRVDCS